MWRADTVRQYFDNISGSSNSNLFNDFFTFDFETVRGNSLRALRRSGAVPRVADLHDGPPRRGGIAERLRPVQPDVRTAACRSTRAVGVRYEKTDVTSSALVPTADRHRLGGGQRVLGAFAPRRPSTTTLEGDYDYVLPSLDFAVDLTDNMKLRASYGQTIGRPGWGDIQGGQTLDQLVRINGGTGAQGNPALKPLESTNIDFSVEWYYAECELPVGRLLPQGHRQLRRHHHGRGDAVRPATPGQGAYFQRGGGERLPDRRPDLHPQLHLRQSRRRSRRDATGVDPNGNRTGTIAGQPGDPIATFAITVPANQRSATLDGWEFNVQHMFGDSGFGVAANYTLVDSSLTYDNQQPRRAVRARRPERFGQRRRVLRELRLAACVPRTTGATSSCRAGSTAPACRTRTTPRSTGSSTSTSSYKWGDNLTLQAEAINLTDEIQRMHGRTAQRGAVRDADRAALHDRSALQVRTVGRREPQSPAARVAGPKKPLPTSGFFVSAWCPTRRAAYSTSVAAAGMR